MRRPVALLTGPRRDALSGVSTHLNLLLTSRLADEFALVHFEVGSEGHCETALVRAVRLIASPFRLGAVLLARRAAIVHLNTALTLRAYWRDLVYAIVAKLCGARLVCQIHGGPLPQAFCRGSRLLADFVSATLRLSDAIVAGYESECDAFRQFLGSTPVFVFPNAVDHEAFATVSHTGSSPQEALRLLYIGRLVHEKGLAEVLEALELTHRRGVETQLVIAGTGPAEGSLRQAAADRGLGNVHFVGPVRGAEKRNLLERADVLVLPTYHVEGLPYALLESMAAGLAVIATPVGAIADLVADGVNGLLIEPRSPPAIAAAIQRLASDRTALAQMSAAARATIVAHYSIDRLADELCSLYRDLCARPTSRRIARTRARD